MEMSRPDDCKSRGYGHIYTELHVCVSCGFYETGWTKTAFSASLAVIVTEDGCRRCFHRELTGVVTLKGSKAYTCALQRHMHLHRFMMMQCNAVDYKAHLIQTL